MVSKASELLPEPDSPVITISRLRGRSRSMFFRLWVRAPRMRMKSMRRGRLGMGEHCSLAGRASPTLTVRTLARTGRPARQVLVFRELSRLLQGLVDGLERRA